jgi:hypothetical protein
MIVRIRIYLQSYIMLWRHVSGPLSVGGDFMSRMHQYAKPAPLSLHATDSAPENSIAIIAKDDISSALESVHGSRNGHLGYRATYLGSDIMSDGVAMYLHWIGTSLRVSLVDVHTSNGVTVKKLIRP